MVTSQQPVVLLIHGLGLKEGEQQEFDKWRSALAEYWTGEPALPALDGVDLRMAYYSDELHPEVVRAAESFALGAPEVAATDAVAGTRAALLDAVADLVLEYGALRRAEQLGRTGVAEALAFGPAAAGAGPTAAAFGPSLPSVTLPPGAAYPTFVRDVTKYFALGVREPVTAVLRRQLDAVRGRPVLLVSHSLGTVVAWDVLANSDYQLDTWITLGCPLGYAQELQRYLQWLRDVEPEAFVRFAERGATAEALLGDVMAFKRRASEKLREVQEALGSAVARAGDAVVDRVQDLLERFRTGPVSFGPSMYYELPAPRFPAAQTRRWYNVFDPDDPVATGWLVGQPALTHLYLDEGRQRVYDVPIRNPRHDNPDPHSEVGYLEALQTSWLIKDFLLRQH